jgi:bacterioferritin (cytochrome b1)
MAKQRFPALTSAEILAGLNEALVAERQAVADYDAHARAAEDLATREALEALCSVEREHVQRLTVRIAALRGTPSTAPAPAPGPARELAAMLRDDLEAEQWAITTYADLVARIIDDVATAELVAELLADEIKHAEWLKAAIRGLEA